MRIRNALAAVVILASSCKSMPAEFPAYVRAGVVMLEDLCAENPDDGLLDLALGFLESGDVPGCIGALKARFIESQSLDGGPDPRVGALLHLLEAGMET